MRILVTGSDGFLGSHLCRALEEDHDVIRLDLKRGHNLLEPRGWAPLLEGVDLVYHLAALADVRSGRDHPTRVFEQNIMATQFLLEAMRAVGVPRIVFTSSAAVYGVLPQVPMPEDGPMPVQNSLYGASKLAAEGLLTAYASTFGFQVGIVRLVQLLGPGYRHGHLWDVYEQLKANPNHLVMQSDGQSKRQYVHVLDAVDALRDMGGEFVEEGCLGPLIWNVAGPDPSVYTIRQSVALACEALAVSPQIQWRDGPAWAGDPPVIHVWTTFRGQYLIVDAIRETVLSFAETAVH